MKSAFGARWVATWSCAHRNVRDARSRYGDRFVVKLPNNVRGSAVRLKYSNSYGDKDAFVLSSDVRVFSAVKGDGVDDNSRPLFCGVFEIDGKPDFMIEPGQYLRSDAMPADIPAGVILAVGISSTGESLMSGNEIEGAGVAMILQSVEILTCDDVRVVACFGDSITHRAHWTAPLTKSLYRRHPGGIAIFEAGINGNRLMGGSPSNIMGFAGRKRFSRDILDVVGLTHVIISIGTNDLGHPGVKEWVPIEELPSFEAFTETMSEIASELTSQEVKGIAATIPPRKWRGEMRETREALRLKINEWMLTCGIFARTLDFASTLKNNANDGLWPDFDGGDGLHINSAGGLAIAANIPSSLFVRNLLTGSASADDDELFEK